MAATLFQPHKERVGESHGSPNGMPCRAGADPYLDKHPMYQGARAGSPPDESIVSQ